MRISDWSSDVCSSDLSAPYSEDPAIDAKVWEILHVAHVFERAGEFDLIHNQADFVPLAFSRLVETPVVTTIHGFSSERIFPVFQSYADRVAYVAISESDRHPSLPYAATIHHGIRSEEHTSALQSLMRSSYAVFCLKKKKQQITTK